MKIKGAWYPSSLPTQIVIQLPNSDLMHFNQTPFREVRESERNPACARRTCAPTVTSIQRVGMICTP